MNLLVDALLARPDVVDLAVQREVTTFDLLLEELGDTLLSGPERESISHGGLFQDLSMAYLPTITAPEWDGALRLAQGQEIATGWWTVMIAASTGGVGLTVPQDSSGTGLVALFTGPAAAAGTLVYDPALGTLVDAPPEVHCAPPRSGRCATGSCGGCHSVKVLDKTGRGIKCRCLHQGQ